jgi:hypothetical protein
MFLHSGTGFHPHEYSVPFQTRTNSIPKRAPLTRSAFSNPIPRKATIFENPTPILAHPGRPLSEIIPRTNEPTVRFQEPEPDTMSEDARSVANSEGSEATAGGSSRRRRSTRSSTAFHLAHPAPTLTQKQRLLHIRPKLLLQLQRLSADYRPKPTLDVLPSTVVVPRLVKKFPRIFRGKGELGCNDVMVVKSEEYDTPVSHSLEESDSDEEGLSNRDLLAVICQLPKDLGRSQGRAEIVLSDGSIWVATPLPNGLYEFVTADERGHKTTARWVRRSTRRKSVDVTEINSINNDIKFTFSIIDPNTRRHPIMAFITRDKLDIPDFYTSVSSSFSKHPPTSPIRATSEPDQPPLDEEPTPERSTHAIDENMKTLIQVTGIWVALREGWCPYFKYDDAVAASSTTTSQQPSAGGRGRSLSLTPDAGRPSPAATCSSTPESSQSTFGAVLGGKIRRSSTKVCPGNGTPPQTEGAVPKRAVSAGTAFMQRAAARRFGNPPSTVASDSEGEGFIPLPNRATSDRLNDTPPNRFSTPPGSLTLPRSSTITPDTPTRPQRRVQSAYIPPSTLQNGFTRGADNASLVSDPKYASDIGERPKISRWKALTNFFKRTNSNHTMNRVH